MGTGGLAAGGPPAYLKTVAEWVGFLAIRLFNWQHEADEPSALRHPLSPSHTSGT